MNLIKSLLRNYLNAGLQHSGDPESNRKAFMVNLFGLIGIGLCILMGFASLFEHELGMALLLFFTAASYAVIYLFQRYTGNKQIYSLFILYSMFTFLIFLVYTGGTENTGPVWIFIAAPVALFFEGLKKGLINISVFTSVILVMFFFPNDTLLATHYSQAFKIRILFSFLAVTLLAAYYEYSRQRSFNFMHKISRKFEQMAKFDPLTHLPNRREAVDKLEYEFRRIERNLSPVAVILCDLDYFKKVNDDHGHIAGDTVLIEIAKLLQNIIRKQDTVARWGGDEFLFVLPQTNSMQALVVAKKIKSKLSDFEIMFDDKKIELTLSMGISEVNVKTPIEQAIKKADENLIKAKENGRNQYYPQPVVYQSQGREAGVSQSII